MKIGIFTETYRPTVNGVVVSIDSFKQELEKEGNEYYIFAPFNKQVTKSEPGVFRFPAVHFPNDNIYPLALPMPLTWAKNQLPLDIIKGLDIIHVQHFATMGQYGLALANEYSIPSVYTYHTMAELYSSYVPLLGPIVKAPIRAWTRKTARLASHVVVPTKSVKHYLRDIGVKKPISIIPTGIETAKYNRTGKSTLSRQYRSKEGEYLLLYVGRLAGEKNIEFLLNAFRLVHEALPNTHLVLAGGGPDKKKFEILVEKWGLAKNITFTGFIARDEVINLFNLADLFVFPSVTDTQGIVIIEAMSAGTVPVAIDRLGPHDIIKDSLTGKLTDLNVNDFSDTILALLRDNAWRRKLAVGAQRAAQYYDAKMTANAMKELYEKLINHPRAKSNS